MEKRNIEEIVKKTIFVASDGKEFPSEIYCAEYEEEIAQEKLEEETNEKIGIKTHADFPSMINTSNPHEYRLFLIKNEDDLDLFVKAYSYWFSKLSSFWEVSKDVFSYPDVLCILDFPKGPDNCRLYKMSHLCNQFSAFAGEVLDLSEKELNLNTPFVEKAKEILGGCDWCKEEANNVADFTNPMSDESLQIQISEGQIQIGLNNSIVAKLDVKYCPMCGRNIGE